MTIAAILLGDLHLSHKPPVARCAEKNWYGAQARLLRQVRDLQDEYRCPLIIDGDLFDDGWRPHKCPPKLVNFAMEWIRNAYAVPGQHDLPHHQIDDIGDSAYWSLVMAGKLTNIDKSIEVPGPCPLRLHGFPWGAPLQPLKEPHDLFLEVAVVHHYCWVDGKCHPGADKADRADNLAKKLRGFDVAAFGDNHTPLRYQDNGVLIYGSGGFQRRRRDEMGHTPSVGLLRANGTIKRHYLDVDADVFADADQTASALADGVIDASAVIDELNNVDDADLDFTEALLTALRTQKQLPKGVRQRILTALEQK